MGNADDMNDIGAPPDAVLVDTTAAGEMSRRSMLSVGLPAVAALLAAGSVPFLIGARRGSAVDAGGIDVVSSTTPPTTSDVLTPASTEPVVLPGATTTAPATTAPPTTAAATTAPSTTLPRPIDAPTDVRGFEESTPLGSMSIPKLGVEEPLLEGIRLTTLDLGPGHWPGSALPGEVGNVVVAAHRTSHGGPFRDIDQLIPGDTVAFSTEHGDSQYRVTGTHVVTPDAMWITDPTPTPTATLFACHPPGSTSHRIVVNLELAD